MIDIKIQTENSNFVYRVAALIILNNKILVQKNNTYDYVTLPGGKCMVNETSNEALKREIFEEMGLVVDHIKTKAIIENFFHSDFDNKNRHELLFINEVKVLGEVDTSKIILNLDDKYDDNQYFEWMNISDLEKVNIKPSFLLNIINSNELLHIINDERKSK